MKKYSRDHPYYLLLWMRHPKERFNRIDKWTIIRYWKQGGEERSELLFYPSEYGMQEIENIKQSKIKTEKDFVLLQCMNQLIDYGNGNYNKTVKTEISPYKWFYRESKKLRRRK